MNTANSEWRPIPDFEGMYSVSSNGSIRNDRTGYILKPLPKRRGYRAVALWKDKKPHSCVIAQLVMSVFVGPRPEGAWINHIDGDKGNNSVANLEYDTPKENHAHAIRLGLKPRGERCGQSKLTATAVQQIRAQRGVVTRRALAATFGVSKSSIDSILSRRTWGHVA